MHVQVRTRTDGTISYNPDKSWDLLMPVVEKIEATLIGKYFPTVAIDKNMVIIRNIEPIIQVCEVTKKESVYLSAVEFIKWYNNEEK